MNEFDFRNLVREMLTAQKAYFKKGRKQSDLKRSIELEELVWKELAPGPEAATSAPGEAGQPRLFDEINE